MNKTNQGREPIYDSNLKIVVAREYLSGNLGYGALARKYELAQGSVRHFVRWYKKHYPEGVEPVVSSGIEPTGGKQFSKQLKEAHLKIAGLEMLIETARKELGIDIVKKFGTKQLPK